MKENMKQVALVVSLFFSVTAIGTAYAEQQQVTISTLRPFVGSLLGNLAKVQLKVAVEPHEGNRVVRVECDGLDGGEFRSGEKQLGGENERSTHYFGFNLSSATYRCTAILKRVVDGKMKEFTNVVEVKVL
ncbi:MAG TPA: hypothetical protein VJ046_00925 [Candidatus Paceibacterota bacterium]|nr:hypothetical protein [Candidatus Paceibacterota bacterium]